MSLQSFLEAKFKCWKPDPPLVLDRTKCSITMDWQQGEPFGFLGNQLLYKIELKNKMPPWVVVYSGGKTAKIIENLAPRHPHKFRLRVSLKATGVPHLAEKTLEYYGDEKTIHEKMENLDNKVSNTEGVMNENEVANKNVDEMGDGIPKVMRAECKKRWLESSWSDETWTSTDTNGSSNVCFCMAVRCGYIKQVQIMLEERPELIGIVNSTNGFTPLAIAVRKGDMNIVRCLLSAGADINQRSTSGQTALHLAVYTQNMGLVELLLDSGADFEARDLNDMRVEHYAVDCGDLDMLKYILDRGDVHVKDSNGWTPLFRALCQGAKTEMIEELVVRGSDIEMSDHAGLPLTSVARILNNRHGRERDSILRLVDRQYPHEKALANFTRLTKKIYHVQTVLK